jgi:hypothetical protein
MANVLKWLGMAAAFVTVAGSAEAADIALSDGQGMGCKLRIDGPIIAGDADRLRDMISAVDPPPFERASPIGDRVCLDSPGGSLAEAVRLSEVLATRIMGTAVPAGATCESACSVLFLAGQFSYIPGETKVFPDRVLHPRGTLGFHAPALLVEDRAYGRDEVNRVYSTALASMGEILRLRSELAVDIPDSLFRTILYTPSTDMTYVETVEQAAQWQIEVAPVSLTASDIDASLRYACLNAEGGMLDQRASDSHLYGSANLVFTFGNLGETSAAVTSRGGFRAEAAANCEMTLFASGDPLERIGYLTMDGGFSNEATRREVFSYLFHDPRLPLSALPVAETEAETGEKAFFKAIGVAARAELSSVDIQACWLLDPEARIVNVNEYVNLRSAPGFEAEILRQVPLGEKVRVIGTQDLRTIATGDRARRCLKACNDLPLAPADPDLRGQVDRCIADNVFWYEIRDASNAAGYVSRRFLGD